ncbi:MAG TPA: branched-chain amino acid ABC transporter permease, partial [Reyranella sp.]|nr:branched-chain amino acid ABC transporter permease [Reyranella sp.]
MTADFLLSLAQAVTKGLLTGMVYGLMALGLSVIFGVMRVVNFAHGEMMVVGMYLAWMGFEYLGVTPLLSLPVIAVLFFFAGYALQRSLISPFIGRPEHQQFLLLLAVAILLVNACLAIAGPDSRGVQLESQFDSYELGPLVFDAVRLHAALAAVAIAALLWLFFTATRTGKSIRAAADNRMGALVVGLDVQRLYAFTFGVGAACVGAAGALMITIIPVTPFLAGEYTLLAFVIVIVGGLGSMTGALMGGLLIGVSEAVAGLLLQPSLKSMFSFG